MPRRTAMAATKDSIRATKKARDVQHPERTKL